MTLRFESYVPDEVRPDGCPDRLPHANAAPRLRLAGIGSILVEKSGLQAWVATEFLCRQTGKIRRWRPKVRTSEVDHAYHAAVVDEQLRGCQSPCVGTIVVTRIKVMSSNTSNAIARPARTNPCAQRCYSSHAFVYENASCIKKSTPCSVDRAAARIGTPASTIMNDSSSSRSLIFE